MKKFFPFLLTVIILLVCQYVFAQEITKGKPGMFPSVIKYSTQMPAFDPAAISITYTDGQVYTLSNGKLNRHNKDAAGMDHYRFQQILYTTPIENAILMVHVQQGRIKSENGKWIKDFPESVARVAKINEISALNRALQEIGANKYKWDIPAEEAFLKREQKNPNATFRPKGSLVYYSGEKDVEPFSLRLAWKFDIYAQEPMSRQIVFVDAENGKILGKRELMHETNANGTAQTVYSGLQSITTDFTGATYRLSETGRGSGINTYNLLTGTTFGAAVDFTDADNNWNNVNVAKDEYATDAHWAAEKTYDYYLQKFSRNSIDGLGMALNSYVHYGAGVFNAYWDGSRMLYGDGDASHGNKPLTSLDVCGHEITHGVTENESALVYSYESGALNEGISDIFGTVIEAYARPTSNDWLVGGDFFTIRSMSNPNAYGQPDTYEGTYWYTGSSDNGGVHTNSGVLNYWFYLLTAGGSGTNDNGFVYNVTGIGMDKAAAITYRMNTNYLVSTADYAAARVAGILAAEELYGQGSPEAIQTANAWDAVGVYAPSCSTVTGLVASPILDRSATLSWDPVLGALSYKVEFKEQAYTAWLTVGTTNNTSIVAPNLLPSTAYDWRVRPNCNSTYSYAQFTSAAPICNPPSGLSFTVTSNSAVLSWFPAFYALSYDVEYKLAADNVWTTLTNTTGTTYTLNGLLASTTYDWRIKTNCSFGVSPYGQSQFTTGSAPCDPPTGLTNTYNPGLNNVMSWNAIPGAVNYEFQFKQPTASWTSASTHVVTDTFYALNGIMSGLTLDWRVRTNCGSNFSTYSVSQLNTPCPTPASIAVSGITSTGAIVNWTPPASFNSPFGYTFQYKLSTATNWISYSPTSGTSITMSGLAPGRTYDCRVRLNCSSFNSNYAQTQFTTLCGITPSGLASGNVTPNSAVLKWNSIPGAASYTLQYKTAAATTWTTVSGITTNSYTLTGLTSATAYNFKVQLVCGVGSGAFSAVSNFSTYCASSGVNSQEWIASFKLGNLERYSGADAGGYFNSAATFTPLNYMIGSTAIPAFISAGFSAGTKTESFAVYIDFNRNGSYADAGERVVGPTTITTGQYNFTVNIPATATPGVAGVRVVMLRQPSTITPCVTGLRGETEDYLINLSTTALQGEAIPVTANESHRSNISVSPNPSNGIFTVTMPAASEGVAYEMMNMNGAVVRSSNKIFKGSLKLDITALPAGLYLLRIKDGNGREYIQKLIRN